MLLSVFSYSFHVIKWMINFIFISVNSIVKSQWFVFCMCSSNVLCMCTVCMGNILC